MREDKAKEKDDKESEDKVTAIIKSNSAKKNEVEPAKAANFFNDYESSSEDDDKDKKSNLKKKEEKANLRVVALCSSYCRSPICHEPCLKRYDSSQATYTCTTEKI